MKIFLSFCFRDENKELVANVKQVITSHGMLSITGEHLGGGQVNTTIESKISECDGLVALFTAFDGNSDWVYYERILATKKAAITMAETGVVLGGLLSTYEKIIIDRSNQLPALLSLSHTLGEWKQKFGRTVKVEVAPPGLAERLGSGDAHISCRYRLWNKGTATEWHDAKPVPEGLGTFIYIDGVQEDQLIQLQVDDKGTIWQSRANPQLMQIELKPNAPEQPR
jgi:hypothetical protein